MSEPANDEPPSMAEILLEAHDEIRRLQAILLSHDRPWLTCERICTLICAGPCEGRAPGPSAARLPQQGQTVDPSIRTGSPVLSDAPTGPLGARDGAAPPAETVGEIEGEARPTSNGSGGAVGTAPVHHVTYIDNAFLSDEWFASCACGWQSDAQPSSKDAKEVAAAHYSDALALTAQEGAPC